MAINPEELMIQAIDDLHKRNIEKLIDELYSSKKITEYKAKKLFKFIDELNFDDYEFVEIYLEIWKFGKKLKLI